MRHDDALFFDQTDYTLFKHSPYSIKRDIHIKFNDLLRRRAAFIGKIGNEILE